MTMPRRLPSPLVIVEALSLLVFLALAGWLLTRPSDSRMVVIDPAALATGPASERWMGIYFQDQPVGYAVSSEVATRDGGRLVQERSVFRIASFGKIHRVVTAGTAVMASGGVLQRFDFLMDSESVRLAVRGEVREGAIHLDIHQGGEIQTLRLPVQDVPQIGMSLPLAIARQPLVVGLQFEMPYFDPVTMAQAAMQVRVTDVEILPGGEEAYWLEMDFSGNKSRMLVTPAGDTIREESAMGLTMVRTTREEAEKLSQGGDPVDMVRMSMVTLDKPLPRARETKTLVVEIEGVEPSRIPSQPPLQVILDQQLSVRVPLFQELPSEKLFPMGDLGSVPQELRPLLEPSTFLPSAHPEVQAAAWEIVGQSSDRLDAALRLEKWVFEELRKTPVIGVPNGLEVLRSKEGDCNEHTALYVTLARAVGLPARTASGIVYAEYSDGSREHPGFYYHAWPEVFLGGDVGWVAVDPTFDQLPADATHIKLVEGELDRQVEIMGFMGRLKLRLIEAR